MKGRSLALLIILTTLLVVATGALLALHYSSSHPVDWTGRTEVSITLTRNGFEPRKFYITKGTKVTFSTIRSSPFWPASDIHPSHLIYPAFDPRTPVAASSTWSFVFNKEGRWGYHNHMEATVTGVVIVVPVGQKGSEKYDALAPCDQSDAEGKKACWREHIQFEFDTKGLDPAFDELSRLYDSDPQFSKQCHTFTHDLGLLAYEKYGDKVPLSLKMGYCNDGFWHGYMEGFFIRHHDPADAIAFCETVKTHFKNTYPLAYTQCHHGIGHGGAEYLVNTRADLWNNIPKLATLFIPICRDVPNDQRNCAYGAYSVLSDWMYLQDRYAAMMQPKAFMSLCAQAGESWAQEGCAFQFSKRMQYQRFLPADDPSNVTGIFDLIFDYGPMIEGGSYIPLMIEGGGMVIGEKGQYQKDTVLVAQCNLLSSALKPWCLRGVAVGLFFFGVPARQTDRIVQFCTNDTMTDKEKSSCASTVLTLLSISYASNQLPQACTRFPETLRAGVTECAGK